MVTRLSGQTSLSGVFFFVSKYPLGTLRQKKLKVCNFDPKAIERTPLIHFVTDVILFSGLRTGLHLIMDVIPVKPVL